MLSTIVVETALCHLVALHDCRGMTLAVGVGDRLCEAHAAEGMLKALTSDGFGKRFKNKRELKRSLQERVQVISQDIGQQAIDASRKMLSFAGL